MTKTLIPFLTSIFLILLCSCNENKADHKKIEVIWKVDSVLTSPDRRTLITTTIKNNSDTDLTADNWSLDYNHIGGRVDDASMPGEITIKNIAGDYFRLAPTISFKELKSGDSRSFSYAVTGYLDKMSEVPVGMFLALNNKAIEVDLSIEGMDEDALQPINPTTASTRFVANNRLTLLPKEDLLPIIPRPRSYQYLEEYKVLGSIVSISVSEELDNEFNALKDGLEKLGFSLKQTENDPDILLALEMSDDRANEAYQLRIDQSGINVTASSKSGIYYGVQSLIQYIQYAQLESNENQIKIRGIDLEDQPRFDYRGMHLDVARNFHSIDNVKRLLDAMSFFKLNKFHFHVTDDEGWRLEIPDLPELTDLGSKRGYTLTEKDHLIPSYGSGASADESYGSGFYSRAEFIDILKYAKSRHIEVITEIDAPAHARAAIKSMELRYDKMMDLGDEEGALEYLLSDPDDESEYGSAQNWNDNVICVCRDGAYNFMEKVLGELVAMYRAADAPLTTLHIGGDEMPYGAWQKSPICLDFIKNDKNLYSSDDLPGYFFNRMQEITNQYNLITGGWEEITLQHNKDGHDGIDINLSLLDKKVQPYVWNAIIGGGRDDMIYRLANAGFPVVMSNSSSFYFDMAYDKDPDEIGLSWSGYADTEKAFRTEPYDLFFGNPVKRDGSPLSEEYLQSREKLTSSGKKNFLGIQAQLWSETIREPSAIEYLVFPKLLGFAERAWASSGIWTNEITLENIDRVYQKDWNLFANTIGQKTLPLLDRFNGGIGYRIPEPGARIVDGKLIANTSFPGVKITYTTGNDQTPKDYVGPVSVENPQLVKVMSQSSTGRQGRTSAVKSE